MEIFAGVLFSCVPHPCLAVKLRALAVTASVRRTHKIVAWRVVCARSRSPAHFLPPGPSLSGTVSLSVAAIRGRHSSFNFSESSNFQGSLPQSCPRRCLHRLRGLSRFRMRMPVLVSQLCPHRQKVELHRLWGTSRLRMRMPVPTSLVCR